MKRWTILKVLDWTRGYFEERGLDSPRLDAEVILSHALGIPRVMLYARHDQPLSEAERDRIRPLVARRGKHEPVAYLTGERGFWSFDLKVGPSTLIPRPDTETLVERALAHLPTGTSAAVARGATGADAGGAAGAEAGGAARAEAGGATEAEAKGATGAEAGGAAGAEAKGAAEAETKGAAVADVGTGSGCVALALARERPQLTVYATDVSNQALVVAAQNAQALGLQDRLRFSQGDLLDALPAEAPPLALVTANLPYIPTAELATLMPDVRDYEPHLALDGGPDGLALIDRLIPQARERLAPGGWLLLEAGDGQLPALGERLTRAGFQDVQLHKDGGGLLRVAEGRRPPG